MSQRTVIILSWVAGLLAGYSPIWLWAWLVEWWATAPNHPEFAPVRNAASGMFWLGGSIAAVLAAIVLLWLFKNYTYHKLARFIR